MRTRTRYALALAGALALAFVQGASAEELVIAVYGGSFHDDTKTCHVAAFEKATGARGVTVLGSSVQTAARLRATRGRPDVDIAYMDLEVAVQAKAEGLLEKVDTSKLVHVKDIVPSAIDPDGNYIGFMTAATVIAYNPQVVKTKPTSWADLWKPEFKGKLALGDITGTSGLQFLLAVNKMRGGTLENVDKGLAAVKELLPSAVTLYTQADQIVSLFERGDVVIAPWYPDRIGSAAAKGVPVAVAYPKEGGVGILPTVSIPKGAKNPQLAMKYIDVLLSPEGQKCFAEKKFAGPVNRKVELSPAAAKVVPFGESLDRLWFPDAKYVAAHRQEWTERWKREMAR
jgi:spermidine/putrescine-binding protein